MCTEFWLARRGCALLPTATSPYPLYTAIIPSLTTPTSGPWRARALLVRRCVHPLHVTPFSAPARRTKRADGRRMHFRMRLGASGRRRKREPPRSSSTIAVAAAAAGHTLAFSPSAYYNIHTDRRRHTRSRTRTHTHA